MGSVSKSVEIEKDETAHVEAATAAGRSKDNYLSAQFRRLAARRGQKRVAVAHSS